MRVEGGREGGEGVMGGEEAIAKYRGIETGRELVNWLAKWKRSHNHSLSSNWSTYREGFTSLPHAYGISQDPFLWGCENEREFA